MYPYFRFKMRKISFQSVCSIGYIECMDIIIPNEQIRQVSFEWKESRPGLLMSIVPLLFSTLQVNISRLFFEKITICFLIEVQIVLECFSICSRKKFREKLQVFIWLYLWFLGDISSDDGYLMELTHLSRNISESSEKSSLSIRNNSIYDPSIILKFLYSVLVVCKWFMSDKYRMNNISRENSWMP